MKNKPAICIVLGTRPEIIKLAPVIRECEKRRLKYFIIHTGQHYMYEMDEIFFANLDLPKPKYNLSVGSGFHGVQTGTMLLEIERILQTECPSVVLVQGDTNTVLAGALAAVKLQIPVGHIEAGLRSLDRTMPEEINRVITDHIADFLFAPTTLAKKNLENEGIAHKKIFVTGNTIVDSVLQNKKLAQEKSDILSQLQIRHKNYFLLTIHRSENTDTKSTLSQIVHALLHIHSSFDDPIVWPLHPRTKNKLETFALYQPLLACEKLKIIDPVGFFDFLVLENSAKLIITDSGGVQEEACILRVPCITLRENTERPETIDVGANIIAGTTSKKILNSIQKFLRTSNNWKNPFGDGRASERILDVIGRFEKKLVS